MPTKRAILAELTLCDPTAGSGGMLIECAHHVEGKGAIRAT